MRIKNVSMFFNPVLSEYGGIVREVVFKIKYLFFCAMAKKVTCTINFMHDHLEGGEDLNDGIHKGFTIGKGKTLYWYIVWNKYGNCIVARPLKGTINVARRYIKGDTEITIHWKY